MDLKELTEKIEDVSKLYSDKYAIHRDDDWYIFKMQEELGELIQKYLMMTDRGRQKGLTKESIREGFEDEVADTFCILLMLVKHFGVDLEKAVSRKWLQYLSGGEK